MPIADVTVRALLRWRGDVAVPSQLGLDAGFDVSDGVRRRPRDVVVGEPAVTDADGRFEVCDVTRIDGALTLIALRAGVRLETRSLPPGSRPGGILEVGEWRLPPRVEVRGQIHDHAGHPVAGAQVRCIDAAQLTRTGDLSVARMLEPDGLILDRERVLAAAGSTPDARGSADPV